MNSNHTGNCPIWGTPATWRYSAEWMLRVDSPRAGGEYRIPQAIEKDIEGRYDDHIKARLTSWLIKQRLLGAKCPKVTGVKIKEASDRQPLSVPERADRLLKYFQRTTQYPGKSFEYNRLRFIDEDSDHFLQIMAWSESIKREETDFFVDYLLKRGWIEKTTQGEVPTTLLLTVDGYIHLAELERTATDSSQAFVAMWFGDSMNPAWEEGIKPAIENAGYTPKRIDKKEHVDKIDDQIIAEIRRSRFIVADFTHGDEGVRGGVYYEAGFAHGLNIPVIFACRKNAFKRIHFDTRQYNHIVWEEPEELRKKLEERIGAVIGQGPVKHNEKAS